MEQKFCLWIRVEISKMGAPACDKPVDIKIDIESILGPINRDNPRFPWWKQ